MTLYMTSNIKSTYPTQNTHAISTAHTSSTQKMAQSTSFDIVKKTGDKKNEAPLSLFQSARNTILQATGIDKSKDLFKELNLPKSLVQYLTKAFGTDDFFVNKDDVTPEDVESGIYKAVCRLDTKAVVLKVLDRKEISKERFEVLSRWENLSLIGVQKCYTSFLQQDKVVYVLEYARRMDDVIKNVKKQKSTISESTIWCVLYQVTKVILALAEVGLHCPNLKTHKLGFASDGEIRLESDIMSLSEEASAMENLIMEDDEPTGVYTSPEVINGEEPTASSLVWELGVITYEIAALEPAYKIEDASNMFEALNDITEGNSPQELSDSYSDDFKQIIKKCLNTDPEKRPSLKDVNSISEGKSTTCDEIKQFL